MANARSIHTKRWIEYFSKESHEIHLITYQEPVFPLEGIIIHVVSKFNNSYLNFFTTYLSIKKIIKHIKPDIIHAHYITDFGFQGALLRFHPFIITAWGSDVLVAPQNSKKVYYFTKYSIQKADLITCDGENLKSAMVKMGLEKEKIEIIQHGVDVKKFNPILRSDDLRKRLNVLDSNLIISTRSLKPIYNIKSLINAIPLVLDQFPKAKFLIVGEGKQKEELVNLAKSLNVLHATIFRDHIPHDELPIYLSSSDVYVSTSLSDGGIAVSTLEAMSCGLPLVVTDVGDIENLVENGKNGFLVPIEDYGLMADKIISILRDDNFKKRTGYNNRKLIEEKADYYKEMQKMDHIYKDLIKRCGK